MHPLKEEWGSNPFIIGGIYGDYIAIIIGIHPHSPSSTSKERGAQWLLSVQLLESMPQVSMLPDTVSWPRVYHLGYMGGCQNYGPFLDAYYNTAPNI